MHNSIYRSFDGTYNNQLNTCLGSANSQLRRFVPASYADKISEPAVRGVSNPNPRFVSNKICRQNYVKFNSNRLTDYVWAWSQFMQHELERNHANKPEEPWNIPVLRGDPKLPQGGTIEFSRSIYDSRTGLSIDNPRQQINMLSSYIDGSNVYGFNLQRARMLRLLDGSGKMKTSHYEHGYLLPIDKKFELTGKPYFVAGDTRVNENVILSTLHTLFVLEHNRLCEELLFHYPSMTGQDEELYQLSRAMVVGMQQAITYNEFLPSLLGDNAIPCYGGYRESIDPTIANVFSAACFRITDSMFSELIHIGRNGDTVPLKKLFLNPQVLVDKGIAPILDGLYRQPMREIDGQMVDDVRNYTQVSKHHKMLMDVAAVNIQRGRDHGLPDLNICRQAVGLEVHNSFDSLTSNSQLARQLELTYGDINSVDPWIGGLVEDHVNNSSVGEFVHTVLVNQFTRIRDGDRFWHQVDPLFFDKPEMLWIVRNTRLADVIRRNTHLEDIPDKLFGQKHLLHT